VPKLSTSQDGNMSSYVGLCGKRCMTWVGHFHFHVTIAVKFYASC
jgi:hypothetical protein